MGYVQTVDAPGGERYMVVAAPPRSALDAGGKTPAGGLIGALVALLGVVIRSGRKGWRIAVTPCDRQGRSTGATHREQLADRGAAEARVGAILGAIRDGHWPEPTSG